MKCIIYYLKIFARFELSWAIDTYELFSCMKKGVYTKKKDKLGLSYVNQSQDLKTSNSKAKFDSILGTQRTHQHTHFVYLHVVTYFKPQIHFLNILQQ